MKAERKIILLNTTEIQKYSLRYFHNIVIEVF